LTESAKPLFISWLFRLGRLDAVGHITHFLCETNARLAHVSLSNGSVFRLRLTQSDIAEIVGITHVHVNRTMHELRELRMCRFRKSVVNMLAPDMLSKRRQLDAAYLRFND
jgi:CRP-like cAMP-binding protein